MQFLHCDSKRRKNYLIIKENINIFLQKTQN